MISREACPRMQRKPRLSGFSSSPVIFTTRPSSTSTSIPHKVGWQFIGHMVRITRVPLPVTGERISRYDPLQNATWARALKMWMGPRSRLNAGWMTGW